MIGVFSLDSILAVSTECQARNNTAVGKECGPPARVEDFTSSQAWTDVESHEKKRFEKELYSLNMFKCC